MSCYHPPANRAEGKRVWAKEPRGALIPTLRDLQFPLDLHPILLQALQRIHRTSGEPELTPRAGGLAGAEGAKSG